MTISLEVGRYVHQNIEWGLLPSDLKGIGNTLDTMNCIKDQVWADMLGWGINNF
jgi:hypothetical protein